MLLNRRDALALAASAALGSAIVAPRSVRAAQNKKGGPVNRSVESWMDEWMAARRTSDDSLHVGRFKDPIYFLLRPISWKPDAGSSTSLEAVEAPTGFVTDFASVPRVFWSVLRPDGEYTYPAILHDYLYWTQSRPKEVADEIFRASMKDFEIDAATIATIYNAVRLGGQSAWDGNAELKRKGEKRILRVFPPARATWGDWKKRPDVFADEAAASQPR